MLANLIHSILFRSRDGSLGIFCKNWERFLVLSKGTPDIVRFSRSYIEIPYSWYFCTIDHLSLLQVLNKPPQFIGNLKITNPCCANPSTCAASPNYVPNVVTLA